jgi:argininosuccinate lyase
MAKLWDKGKSTDDMVMEFTTGNDYIIDMNLVPADILGNIAHVRMLHKIGMFNDEQLDTIEGGLHAILEDFKQGKFEITPDMEDVHTAVENALTERIGELGQRIHLGRSRNDQSIVDMRLYVRDMLLQVTVAALDAADTILHFARRWWDTPMPGYTHTRPAMPSSMGLWAGAIGEQILDDLMLTGAAYALVDQCPLGSAAGYGVNMKIDREFTSEQLGFAKVQKNTLAVQNSRGKFELSVIQACQHLMIDLSRAAADIIFFSQAELGFITIPDSLTTGSSIMPHKKNPDVLELVRSKAAEINGLASSVAGMLTGLVSGYSRDLQLTKEPTIKALDITHSSLCIMKRMFEGLVVDDKKCTAAFTPDLFAADAANEGAIQKNIPFRKAYQIVAENLDKMQMGNPKLIFKSRTHLGAPGNLKVEDDHKRLDLHRLAIVHRLKTSDDVIKRLLTKTSEGGQPAPEAKE